MKRLLTLAAFAGMLAAQPSFALIVDVNRTPGAGVSPGGEFTVTSVAPDPAFNAILAKYAPAATVGGGFQTFCLSLTTELLGNPQVGTLDPSGVAAGTAFLYSGFAGGALSGYNYTFGASRMNSAVQLQSAIWYLQGFSQSQINSAYGSSVFDPTVDTFVKDAITKFGTLANAEAANNGGFGVDALKLNGPTGAPSQPMLALVPDGASTIMLLFFALSGLGVVSRKIRA
jgi:hypothetical protein